MFPLICSADIQNVKLKQETPVREFRYAYITKNIFCFYFKKKKNRRYAYFACI